MNELLATFKATLDESVTRFERSAADPFLSKAGRLRYEGMVEVYKALQEEMAETLRKQLSERDVTAIVNRWRMQAIQQLSQAFLSEKETRYGSRVALGRVNAYTIAAIELDRLLRRQKEKVTDAAEASLRPAV